MEIVMKLMSLLLVVAAIAASLLLWMQRDCLVERSAPEITQASVDNFAYRKPLIISTPTEQDSKTVLDAQTTPEFEANSTDNILPTATPVSLSETDCLVLSPVPESMLSMLTPKLESIGFINRALVQKAEYFEMLVYAGPFKTESAAKALYRRLLKKKINSRVEGLPDGRWRLVLKTFADKIEAKKWAASIARNEQISNIVVADNSPGGNSVQIVFAQLTTEENKRIRSLFSSGIAGATVFACRP